MAENNLSTTDNGDVKRSSFFSLRWKLLIGFTVLFSVVFAAAFYWFFTTATNLALGRIQEDLSDTVQAAVEGVNHEELLALAADGVPNDAGYSDDQRFNNQLDWLEVVHQIEPRAWPYVYIRGEGENEVFFVADLWARYDDDRSASFMEPYTSTGSLIRGLDELTFRLNDQGEFDTYTDSFGRWVSAYAPVMNDQGEIVAAVGVDFRAEYVDNVRQSILSQMLTAFLITYAILFILVFAFSQIFTRPIAQLTDAAELIGEGDYEQDLSEIGAQRFRDEIGRLADVFDIMVEKVYEREQKLLRQVAELRIEIDKGQQSEQVDEIVETDFFRELQSRAAKLRQERDQDE
ncbi:MAG: HAMP domain-containing protein [Chloroflexi bacterium]|nr:MAG: HAMP domain-containing protein [Chloroflexota bacterium]MBL1195414.1 HAMP domain-containing protein [Chloroflexota bacterium]NOH12697.1 HAMP domain-containing protein [Chloroflexota bacterium]